MTDKALPSSLTKNRLFSRQEYSRAMSAEYNMTKPQISYDLQKRINTGELVREARGIYSRSDNRRHYHYDYQPVVRSIVKSLTDEYVDLDFRIFELIQLNDFINHLAGRNALIVYVENELTELVFNTLAGAYPGKVLFKPRADDFYRYFQDDQIVVCRLISEAPKGSDNYWEIRLEQIIVDIFSDKLVSQIVPGEEKAKVVTGAFDSYIIDESAMFRYARRRGAEQKMETILDNCRKGIHI